MTSESEQAERRERLLGQLSRASDEEVKQAVREAYSKLSAELGKLSPEQAVWNPAPANGPRPRSVTTSPSAPERSATSPACWPEANRRGCGLGPGA